MFLKKFKEENIDTSNFLKL